MQDIDVDFSEERKTPKSSHPHEDDTIDSEEDTKPMLGEMLSRRKDEDEEV